MLKCAILELHVLQKLDMFMGSVFGTIGFGCFPRCQKRSKGMRAKGSLASPRIASHT